MDLPSLGAFKTDSLLPARSNGGKKGPLFRRVCVFDVSRAVGIKSVSEIAAESHDTTPLSFNTVLVILKAPSLF